MTPLPRNYRIQNSHKSQVTSPTAIHAQILSPWRQLLSLPLPCHKHWPRSCWQRPARTAAICPATSPQRTPPTSSARHRPPAPMSLPRLPPPTHAARSPPACRHGPRTHVVACKRGLPRKPGFFRVRERCAGGRVGGWSTLCVPAVRD